MAYSPTDKEDIDRATSHARRLLSSHNMVLTMLFSRLQAARYRRPDVMFVIQSLVFRSARAHKALRYAHIIFGSLNTLDVLRSTHPLAREARFSFLLFGFETLKGSHLDAYCENALRESLYGTAYSWFAVRPQYAKSVL